MTAGTGRSAAAGVSWQPPRAIGSRAAPRAHELSVADTGVEVRPVDMGDVVSGAEQPAGVPGAACCPGRSSGG